MTSEPTPPADPTPPAAPTTQADPRPHLLDLPLPELRQWLLDQGEARYRAEQLVEWIYDKLAVDLADMTVLSKPLRAKLAEQATLYRSEILKTSVATDQTAKLLVGWPDGSSVETVWIPDGQRHTACLSSQVGCPVGCAFCASGIDGKVRNLTAGEIVEQALRVARMVRQSTGGERLSNIVMMGMGEPLANYDNVIAAIRTINASWGLNIGARKITVSTVGLPAQIKRLAGEDLQLNLALSLHAPDDELRQRLIPWGKVPIRELLDACGFYFQETGREITLEYVLLAGVNDQPAHAVKLAKIARDLRANINLLRYNPVPGLPFDRPAAEDAYRFQQMVRDHGANVHLRKSRGRDIAAACGQLRRDQNAPPPVPLPAKPIGGSETP